MSYQKKVYERVGRRANVEIEKSRSYTMNAEIGILKINTHNIKSGNFSLYDTGRDVFPKIKPKENYRTACMDELMLMFPCDESYRNSAAKINRVLWRDEEYSIKSRTLDDIVIREGESILECLSKKTQVILTANGFDELAKPLPGAIVVTEDRMIDLPHGQKFSLEFRATRS